MTRPLFDIAWAASRRIYDPANPGTKVAEVIGGNVAINIVSSKKPWKNTCAVRMSYILNQSSVLVPYIPGQTVSGADKRWYFHRIDDVIGFLTQRWGKPDLIVPYPPHGGGDQLVGKKGVVLFEVSGCHESTDNIPGRDVISGLPYGAFIVRGVDTHRHGCWVDARGHATLWNGTTCYDHCFFNESGAAYRTDRANFWSLP